MSVRKVIYVSGTRADYGLMRKVLKTLNNSKDFDLSILVTAMHLSPMYGNTIEEIQSEEFKICGAIKVDVEHTTHHAMAKAIGHEIIAMTEIFADVKPDLIILLGDRGESLAAAITAAHLNIPIVHIHGGERSGTVDEMVRHAISKFAHYHFVATQGSKDRLIKMGETEESIFVVGAPGLDELYDYKSISKKEFCKRYRFNESKKIALLVYHPVVQEYENIGLQFKKTINVALELGLQIICLEPNSDAGGHLIREAINEYVHHEDVRVFKHLQRQEYIDCLAHVDVLIGNSSSGIIEAASFNLSVLNIGSRQNLREVGDNVIHVNPEYDEIFAGLKSVLESPKKKYINVYGDGKTSERCYHLLKTINLDSQILKKSNAY